MRKLIPSCALVALFLPFAAQLQAQDENLVPNGSFENGDAKKLKAYGQLEQFTTDWFAYTDAPLDWYSTEVKGEKVAVPANSYGYEDPSDGNRYGGFRAHTKSPKLARTYFQVRLSENLEANAKAKLHGKNCDWVIANQIGEEGTGFASDNNAIIILKKDGTRVTHGPTSKLALAQTIIQAIADTLENTSSSE